MIGPDITNIDISGNLPIFWWLVFALAMAVFVSISLVLLYHWRMYGIKSRRIIIAETVYFIVSVILCIASFMALIFVK
mgnify:CR=1